MVLPSIGLHEAMAPCGSRTGYLSHDAAVYCLFPTDQSLTRTGLPIRLDLWWRLMDGRTCESPGGDIGPPAEQRSGVRGEGVPGGPRESRTSRTGGGGGGSLDVLAGHSKPIKGPEKTLLFRNRTLEDIMWPYLVRRGRSRGRSEGRREE